MSTPEEPRRRVKDLVGTVARWLGGGEREAVPASAPAPDSDASTVEGVDGPPAQAPAGLSRQTLTAAEKMSSFRKAIEFEEGVGSRLKDVHSEHALLLYLYDVLFFRFVQLRDLGLLSDNSVNFLEVLSEKFGAVLSSQEVSEATSESEAAGRESGGKGLSAGHTIVKSGIVTENELHLEEQVKYLQVRVREQHAKLQVARQKFKLLASYQEMILSLRARNGLLTSKLDHQTRLLHSLAADNPKHKELFATVDRLREDNARLRGELDRQMEVFQRIRTVLPDAEQNTVNGILANNADLRADLEARDEQIDQMTRECGKDPELLCYIDSLTEQNNRLKEALASQNMIEGYVAKCEGGEEDVSGIVEALRSENQRLQLALSAREEQVNLLTSDPVNRQLKDAFQRLQADHRQVLKENQLKEQLYRHELQEKQALLLQLRETSTLSKENQRLRGELETSQRIVDVLKKRDFQFQVLRKRHSELVSRYERTSGSLEKAHQKLAKITAEYNLLIKEYEHIFGNR